MQSLQKRHSIVISSTINTSTAAAILFFLFLLFNIFSHISKSLFLLQYKCPKQIFFRYLNYTAYLNVLSGTLNLINILYIIFTLAQAGWGIIIRTFNRLLEVYCFHITIFNGMYYTMCHMFINNLFTKIM